MKSKSQKIDGKFVGIVVLLVAACSFSWGHFFKNYHQEDTVDIHLFPKTVGEWESKELTITEEEYAILETRNAFARKYSTEDGKHAILFVVYSQNNRKVSHPPEVCYIGSGVSVVSNEPKPIVEFPSDQFVGIEPVESARVVANRLLLEQSVAQQVAYYWFKVGDVFTEKYWKQQLLIPLRSLLGQNASSAMIRISSTVKGGEVDKADQDAQEFAHLIYPLLNQYLP